MPDRRWYCSVDLHNSISRTLTIIWNILFAHKGRKSLISSHFKPHIYIVIEAKGRIFGVVE